MSNISGKFAVYSPSTWTGGSPPNNVSGNTTVSQKTDRSSKTSLPNSGRRGEVTETSAADSADPAFYKKVGS